MIFLKRFTIFARLLAKEYLGLSGLFTNIISVLSLSELGIGNAIIVSLYRPLADNDQEKVSKLMNFYRRAYTVIGIFVICCGLILMPFLDYLVKTDVEIPYLKFYFMMFIVQSASSYFFAYKQSIVTASQQEYILSFFRQIFVIAARVLEIVVLLLTHNYTLYLSISILSIIGTNFTIAVIANKKFPFLKTNKKAALEKGERKKLFVNISSMMLHKVGRVVINSTDNILISSMVGLIFAGLYSNYLMIINVLMQVITIVFSAVSASIGDYNARKTDEESYKLFKVLDVFSFWLFGMSSICLFVLFQPTISIWLGEDFLLDGLCVAVIIFNYYVAGMLRITGTFIDVTGLYNKTKFKPITMAIINLGVSIICAKWWGLIGIFIGTAVSYITVGMWVDPHYLYKYKFKVSVLRYWLSYLVRVLILLGVGTVTYIVVAYINNYFLKVIVCFIMANVGILLFYFRTVEFKYIIDRIKSLLHRKKVTDK